MFFLLYRIKIFYLKIYFTIVHATFTSPPAPLVWGRTTSTRSDYHPISPPSPSLLGDAQLPLKATPMLPPRFADGDGGSCFRVEIVRS